MKEALPKLRTVYRRLAKLGRTPQAIARALWKLGIRGVPRHGTYCALAVYVRREFPHAYWISVFGNRCYLFGKEQPLQNVRIVELPTHLETFAARFDAGRYPRLQVERLPARGK